MSVELILRGEQIVLRPDRSLFWPSRRTLVIADSHFGKVDAFRAAGVAVPGSAELVLARLAAALDDTEAERLLILGDFWHVREGRTEVVLEMLAAWRAARPYLRIELVRGNHDRAGLPPANWSDGWLSVISDPPFAFAHLPEPVDGAYVLAGHLHPGVVLTGLGRQRLRLPCFWFGQHVGVLPAFGEFTGAAGVSRKPGDRVFAIADGEVVDIPGE